jgi:hypothetical protein
LESFLSLRDDSNFKQRRMKRWVLKAIIQKIVSFLPFKNRINFLFQKYVTKGVKLTDDYFTDRLIHVQNHIQGYNLLSGKGVTPLATLELGTGWYPIVPIALFLSGSEEIYSVDLVRLVNRNRLIESIDKFIQYHLENKLSKYFNVDPNRINELIKITELKETKKVDEILGKLRITLLVQDACNLKFNDNYFDIVHSNNTFEHINQSILEQIIVELYRIVKKDGVMSHFIDMSDHFAHFDKSITIYNFLKFSNKTWRLIDNKIQPQNRLRLIDYEKVLDHLGITYNLLNVRKGSIEELNLIKLSGEFENYDKVLMAVSHCQLVSVKI